MQANNEKSDTSNFRVFKWNNMFYASAFSKIYRSPDRNKPFELRKTDFFPWRVRHTAVLLKGDDMWVFQSRYGDAPEYIMVSTLKLTPDWNEWTPSEPVTVLKPEKDFEGVNEPVEPSAGGLSHGPVHQLRDPAIYREDDRIYLLYSVAGECGIAITQVDTALWDC